MLKVELRPRGIAINPVYISTEGKLWLQFAPLIGKPIFDDASLRAELRNRFAEIISSDLSSADLSGYAKLPFAIIAADSKGLDKVVSAWQWVIEQVRKRV